MWSRLAQPCGPGCSPTRPRSMMVHSLIPNRETLATQLERLCRVCHADEVRLQYHVIRAADLSDPGCVVHAATPCDPSCNPVVQAATPRDPSCNPVVQAATPCDLGGALRAGDLPGHLTRREPARRKRRLGSAAAGYLGRLGRTPQAPGCAALHTRGQWPRRSAPSGRLRPGRAARPCGPYAVARLPRR